VKPRVYGTTVSVVDPLTEFNFAVMLVVPAPALEATPFVLMVATAGTEELHVTELVMFCVVLSLKVPTAVNGRVWLSVRLGVAGVTAMETSVAWEIDNLAGPIIGPSTAPIRLLPGAAAVATPRLPEESLMVATCKSEEVQFTKGLKYCML